MKAYKVEQFDYMGFSDDIITRYFFKKIDADAYYLDLINKTKEDDNYDDTQEPTRTFTDEAEITELSMWQEQAEDNEKVTYPIEIRKTEIDIIDEVISNAK